MSMSTRESMRRELKELAKLAETMGKQPVAETAAEGQVEFPVHTLERPVTPASASRVSVAPFTTPTVPPVFDIEPKAAPKRTGIIAVVVGASLAIALVGGAAVGMGHGPAETHAAAATLAAPPVEAPVPQAAAPQAAPEAVTPPPPQSILPAAAAPATPAPVAKAAPAPAPVVHKHVAPAAKPAAAPVAAAPAKAAKSDTDSDGIAAAPAAKPAAAPKAASKPAAASGGGGDSLEDLIRKEVAAHK